jgi:soluble lytic murein transglycosylase-like protein
MTTQNAWVMRLPWDRIDDAAEAENVPADLLGAIVQTESSGNQFALRAETKHAWIIDPATHNKTGLSLRSHYVYLWKPEECARQAGVTTDTEIWSQVASWGLCQLMGAVARELGLKGPIVQLLQVDTNLKYAALLLKRLAKRYDKADDILAAYNAGSAVKLINGQYRNQDYVDKANLHLSAIKLARGQNGKST